MLYPTIHPADSDASAVPLLFPRPGQDHPPDEFKYSIQIVPTAIGHPHPRYTQKSKGWHYSVSSPHPPCAATVAVSATGSVPGHVGF